MADELIPCGPSKCEGYYHGDDSDPDICDAYEASEIPAPCENYGRRCVEFYPAPKKKTRKDPT